MNSLEFHLLDLAKQSRIKQMRASDAQTCLKHWLVEVFCIANAQPEIKRVNDISTFGNVNAIGVWNAARLRDLEKSV